MKSTNDFTPAPNIKTGLRLTHFHRRPMGQQIRNGAQSKRVNEIWETDFAPVLNFVGCVSSVPIFLECP
uniref:Uncharacterized protein n=1 Tax=Caenorhabditis japonica TaxID=281687 RepID=A0A8R1INR0_CAEJA